MSVPDNKGSLLINDSETSSKKFLTFCVQLVHHSQWKSIRSFRSGSNVESPANLALASKYKLDASLLDIDVMNYSTYDYAIQPSSTFPANYFGRIIRIYDGDAYNGFVRLLQEEKDNAELTISDLCQLTGYEILHGPAILQNFGQSFLESNYSLKKYAEDTTWLMERIQLQDTVNAVHSPYWPIEATEWITRKRSQGFPSKSVIKQVVRYGCDFVQVSHNKIYNDGEWRISFSKAELLIAKSWTKSQKIVYSTLWLLNKRIADSKLCSYYFKTFVFWACEEQSKEFWREDQLVNSVCELLLEITKWINAKFCQNYFIPRNNMLSNLIYADLSNEIDALTAFSRTPRFISEIIDNCREVELEFINTRNIIESTAWINRTFVIYYRLNNTFDYYADLFCTNFPADLQNALYVELSDIYRGLCFQKKSVSCASETDKHIYLLKSECHLQLAANQCESQQRDEMHNCSLNFVTSITSNFIRCTAKISNEKDSMTWDIDALNDRNKASTDNAGNGELNVQLASTLHRQNKMPDDRECKGLLYSRSVEKHESTIINDCFSERIREDRNISMKLFTVVSQLNTYSDSRVVFFNELPGQSPTVNISWFIAKAYLANIYYITQRDAKLTMKTCDDIIAVYKQSLMNEMFAERTFPVVLSTQWTSIYDKEIQELLGFYSLCSYVLDPTSRSMYLGICPVQFAYYLKGRILYLDEAVLSKPNKCIPSDYFDHNTVCGCDRNVKNGSVILFEALSNYCAKITLY